MSVADPADPPVRLISVPEEYAGQRIDSVLTAMCDGFSRTQIRDAIQNDAAVVDGKLVRPSFKVVAGQSIRFTLPPPPVDHNRPENIPLDVLFEDDGLVVVNKPAGMVVHPARGHWSGTLTAALAYRFAALSDVGGPSRPGIVHRLDRDTSGVIVVAKTNATHLHLSTQFHDRQVQKEYIAITAGRIDRDRDWIDAPIGKHPYQRDKMAVRPGHDTAKPAQTFYEVTRRIGRISLVTVRPKTGRTHQIRVHLAHVGCPILCDRLYAGHGSITLSDLKRSTGVEYPGDDSTNILERHALHAHRLTITNPRSGCEQTFVAPLAADMQSVIDRLQS